MCRRRHCGRRCPPGGVAVGEVAAVVARGSRRAFADALGPRSTPSGGSWPPPALELRDFGGYDGLPWMVAGRATRRRRLRATRRSRSAGAAATRRRPAAGVAGAALTGAPRWLARSTSQARPAMSSTAERARREPNHIGTPPAPPPRLRACPRTTVRPLKGARPPERTQTTMNPKLGTRLAAVGVLAIAALAGPAR
jgi:hypothetical protein